MNTYTNETMNYEILPDSKFPVKSWTKGVLFEEEARKQLLNVADLPFIHKWVAAMPDVHAGMGATIGSVIPTHEAIIPAAVGVDIGCGMMAVQTSLTASDLPENLKQIRLQIESRIPHGRTHNGGRHDRGAWGKLPKDVTQAWSGIQEEYKKILQLHPRLQRANSVNHLGTLGTGNHFIELCLDESQKLWVMLHSGSRGIGNAIGTHFIRLAKDEMKRFFVNLPDSNLAYLPEGSKHFGEYVKAVHWAQDFARINRELMMNRVLKVLGENTSLPEFTTTMQAINCHHNYVNKEHHYGADVWITRKGAVQAQEGTMGIIPGSMGTRSYIVKGKGNPESFNSCSHGAGRSMSRTAARKHFTLEDHKKATLGVECRVDSDVIDETPGAYKDIDTVMEAQKDLVEVVHTLKQIVCVKG